MRGGLGLREFVILICLYEQVCLSYTDQIIIISVVKGVGLGIGGAELLIGSWLNNNNN